jgi:hypothetical protein
MNGDQKAGAAALCGSGFRTVSQFLFLPIIPLNGHRTRRTSPYSKSLAKVRDRSDVSLEAFLFPDSLFPAFSLRLHQRRNQLILPLIRHRIRIRQNAQPHHRRHHSHRQKSRPGRPHRPAQRAQLKYQRAYP